VGVISVSLKGNVATAPREISLWDKADRGGVAQAEVALSGAVV
jgi:hypothetical protein